MDSRRSWRQTISPHIYNAAALRSSEGRQAGIALPVPGGSSKCYGELGGEGGAAAAGEAKRAAAADADDPLLVEREVGDRGAEAAGEVGDALAPVEAGAGERAARARVVGERVAVVGEPGQEGGGGGERLLVRPEPAAVDERAGDADAEDACEVVVAGASEAQLAGARGGGGGGDGRCRGDREASDRFEELGDGGAGEPDAALAAVM